MWNNEPCGGCGSESREPRDRPKIPSELRLHQIQTQVYRGGIDNRYVDFGKSRPQPTRHVLQDVLNALLSGSELTFRSEKATGCLISDLRH